MSTWIGCTCELCWEVIGAARNQSGGFEALCGPPCRMHGNHSMMSPLRPTHGPLCGCSVCWTLDGLDDDRDGKAIARAAECFYDCD